jgi:hypothetical protein
MEPESVVVTDSSATESLVMEPHHPGLQHALVASELSAEDGHMKASGQADAPAEGTVINLEVGTAMDMGHGKAQGTTRGAGLGETEGAQLGEAEGAQLSGTERAQLSGPVKAPVAALWEAAYAGNLPAVQDLVDKLTSVRALIFILAYIYSIFLIM